MHNAWADAAWKFDCQHTIGQMHAHTAAIQALSLTFWGKQKLCCCCVLPPHFVSDEWRIYDYAIKGVMYVCRDVFRIMEIIHHKVWLIAPLLIKIKQSTVLPQLGVLQCTYMIT